MHLPLENVNKTLTFEKHLQWPGQLDIETKRVNIYIWFLMILTLRQILDTLNFLVTCVNMEKESITVWRISAWIRYKKQYPTNKSYLRTKRLIEHAQSVQGHTVEHLH